MKVLITGITGMVGSHLTDFLLENTNWDIYGMCRWRSPKDNVNHILTRVNKKDRVFFLFGDLRDYISLQNVVNEVKPDYVYHLAAVSNIDHVIEKPIETINYNVMGTAFLLEEARQSNIKRFFLASSVFVFEKSGHFYTSSKYFSEIFPLCCNLSIAF